MTGASRLRPAALALATVLLALAATWLTPGPAYACSCAALSDAQYAEGADTIFTGTVADDQQGMPRTLTFTVDRVYKGAVQTTQVVTTAGSGSSCGLEISGAGPFLVYAQQGQTGLTAGLCGGTGPGPAPASLGLGQPPRPDPTRTDPGPGAGYWIPVIGLALAASAAGLVGWSLIRRQPT